MEIELFLGPCCTPKSWNQMISARTIRPVTRSVLLNSYCSYLFSSIRGLPPPRSLPLGLSMAHLATCDSKATIIGKYPCYVRSFLLLVAMASNLLEMASTELRTCYYIYILYDTCPRKVTWHQQAAKTSENSMLNLHQSDVQQIQPCILRN